MQQKKTGRDARQKRLERLKQQGGAAGREWAAAEQAAEATYRQARWLKEADPGLVLAARIGAVVGFVQGWAQLKLGDRVEVTRFRAFPGCPVKAAVIWGSGRWRVLVDDRLVDADLLDVCFHELAHVARGDAVKSDGPDVTAFDLDFLEGRQTVGGQMRAEAHAGSVAKWDPAVESWCDNWAAERVAELWPALARALDEVGL